MNFAFSNSDTQEVSVLPLNSVELTDINPVTQAELRRRMYERIARGNAMEEAEESSRRKWRGN